MIAIAKTWVISASHQLKHLAPDHPCARLHGHNYEITLEVRSKRDNAMSRETGFIIDYHDLDDTFGAWLMKAWDHRHLNEVLGSESGKATTAEHLSVTLFAKAVELLRKRDDTVRVVSVMVRETPKTYAIARAE
mgnify:CR=1 FL=1